MDFDGLYQEFINKKQAYLSKQQFQKQQFDHIHLHNKEISHRSNNNTDYHHQHKQHHQKPININTHIQNSLQRFPDDELINLQTSIPILRTVNIIKELNSVQDAKRKFDTNRQSARLKYETNLLYFLWEMINQQEIDCRELKQIIKITQDFSVEELPYVLKQLYSNGESVDNYVAAWIEILRIREYERKQEHVKNKVMSYINEHESIDRKKKQYTHNQYQQEEFYQQNTSHFNPNAVNRQTNFYNSHQHYKKGDDSNIASPIAHNGRSQKRVLRDTTNFINHPQFNQSLALSVNQQKQLVSRLYRNDKYKQREELKKQMELKKEKEEMKQCTFKPNIQNRGRSASQCKKPKQIKGYDKAISRLKLGTQKNKISKQLREYKPIGQNYQKMRQKSINPPKFLERKKKQNDKYLFSICFDIGRYKTNIKIREGDTQESVAERLCKIYSLKGQFYDEICKIMREQLEAYYQEQYQEQCDSIQQYQ